VSRKRRDDETVLDVLCPSCGQVLAVVPRPVGRLGELVELVARCEWNLDTPPDTTAPDGRFTFWCPGRRREREHKPAPVQHRVDVLIATLDAMERQGARRATING
jgi:hypothetical protein